MKLIKKWLLKILYCERGGGGTEIQQAPPQPPAPSASETAKDLYEARLQYDPQVASMEQGLQQQYAPQQAALQAALYQQYAPMLAGSQQQLREQYAPTQTAVTEQLGQRALSELQRPEDALLQSLGATAQQQLQSPYGYSPQEQSSIDAIRGRQMGKTQEAIRTQANLGGGLFGGRTQARESEAMQQMGQQFAQEDVGRMLGQQGQAQQLALQVPQAQAAQRAEGLRYSIPVAQQLYPQTQFPGMPQQAPAVQQGVTPGADTLYNAMYGAGRNEYYATQQPDYFGSIMGAMGGLGGGWLAGR